MRPGYFDYHTRLKRRRRKNLIKMISWTLGITIVMVVVFNALETEDAPYGNYNASSK